MRTAQVVQETDGQSVRLPQDVRLSGARVYVKRVGNVIVLIPEDNPWQALFDSLTLFTPDYMAERGQPPAQAREEVFA